MRSVITGLLNQLLPFAGGHTGVGSRDAQAGENCPAKCGRVDLPATLQNIVYGIEVETPLINEETDTRLIIR